MTVARILAFAAAITANQRGAVRLGLRGGTHVFDINLVNRICALITFNRTDAIRFDPRVGPREGLTVALFTTHPIGPLALGLYLDFGLGGGFACCSASSFNAPRNP